MLATVAAVLLSEDVSFGEGIFVDDGDLGCGTGWIVGVLANSQLS